MAAFQVMSFETVNYELKDSVAVITLNRPDALNALSQQLTRDLRAAVDKVAEDGARAAILTGAGRAFCAGGDLKEMQEIGEKEGKVEAFLDGPLKALHNIIRAIRKSPVPFVAAVNGVCAGAGRQFRTRLRYYCRVR
jgi:enoyl-CoA hydratase/carnithine racemase